MRIKINWHATIPAILITATLIVFPFANPCTGDPIACSTDTKTHYYGLTLDRH